MGSIKVTLPNWSSQFSTQILKDTQVPANYVKLTLEVYMYIYKYREGGRKTDMETDGEIIYRILPHRNFTVFYCIRIYVYLKQKIQRRCYTVCQ